VTLEGVRHGKKRSGEVDLPDRGSREVTVESAGPRSVYLFRVIELLELKGEERCAGKIRSIGSERGHKLGRKSPLRVKKRE